MAAGRIVVGQLRIRTATEADEILRSTSEGVVERLEDDLPQESIQFGKVIRVVWTHQQVNVDKVTFDRPRVQPQLNVREEIASLKMTGFLARNDSFVRAGHAIVRHADRMDLR